MSQINVENMRKWVRALRSGEYKQGRGMLRTEDQFCCLGIACDISGLDVWEAAEIEPGTCSYSYKGNTQLLPGAVSDWLGGIHSNPRLRTREGFSISAANWNDSGAAFSKIADAIERTWPEVKESAS